MKKTLTRARRFIGRLGYAAMAFGAAVIVVQAAWVSYGVVMRYVFRSPDAVVTEATALLLFPVAFAGLAYALDMDAYPRVTALTDKLPPRAARFLECFNRFMMSAIGGFFAVAASQAAWRDFHSGASSEILLWPRWIFWSPAAIALWLFSVFAVLCFLESLLNAEDA